MYFRRICFFLLLVSLLLFSFCAVGEGSPYQALPFPGKNLAPEDFFIGQDGSLMVHKKDGDYVFTENTWLPTELSAKASPYTVEHKTITDWVITKDGMPIYRDNGDLAFHTLYPVDDETAYATLDNKVYRVDLTTGLRKAVCTIDGFEAADWADGLLVSGNVIYVMQTQIPLLQMIDLDVIAAQGFKFLTIAITSKMDIGNVVLNTAEQNFMERFPNTFLDMVKMTADQCRLNLMSDPSAYDIIVADPSLWDDLAGANIFEDLEAHESLAAAWQSWIDMSTLCRYEGKLYGALLWDSADILWVNEALVPLFADVTWPDEHWTWSDFLSLARECCRDLNGDGKNDLYIAYQHMFYPAWNITHSYSLPVHQAALLYRHGVLTNLDCAPIFDMLTVWKTLWEEGLLCPEEGSYENPHNSIVVFAENLPPEWCQYIDAADIRLTIPALTGNLRCVPSEGVLMSINKHSANMEEAVSFMEEYMLYGADEHNYLQTHTNQINELQGNPAWKTPDELHEAHYIATMQSLYRDDWDMSIYNDMEQQFTAYLQGQISAQECVQLWQQKLRMAQME